MKRTLLAGLLVLLLLCALAVSASADGASYTEKTVPVIVNVNGEKADEVTLRFYDETPHVPYWGLNAYSQYMKHQPLRLVKEDGTLAMENGIGEKLFCDITAGQITVPNWNRFFDLPLPLEDEALGWKDTATRFARITAIDFEGEPAPVTLDFAKYGIKMYADGDDIYLPVSVLSNMMTDIATNHLLYNGENLYALRFDLEGRPVEGFFESEQLQAEMKGGKRPEDLVRQCYADLCFNFDYFFGHPGKAVLDGPLAEKGLDRALTDLGEDGLAIKAGLLSSDFGEYVSALTRLFAIDLSDGHTVFIGGMQILQEPAFASNPAVSEMTVLGFPTSYLKSPLILKQLRNETIPLMRSQAWGDEPYREYGSTAILRLDSFMPDEQAWADYYDGKGAFPTDDLGNVVSGLRKASENPAIENIIFDLSCNSGGSPDVMMAILALTTGQNQLYGFQKMTGQKMTFTFDIDTNFDGVFDEKDQDVRYDYNYGVLVTRHAFSCGNLFPIIIREAGAVLIGEPSSGGSCCVQVGSDAEGLSYMLSSAQWQLTDSQFVSVEGGCGIDIAIQPKSNSILDAVVSFAGIDDGLPAYMNYFDDANLDQLMRIWFRQGAQAALAA